MVRGQCREALIDLAEAVSAFTASGSTYGVARAYMSISEVHRDLGRYSEAVHYGQKAAALAAEIDDPIGEGIALRDLGAVHLCQGDLDAADNLLTQALHRMNNGYPFGETRAISYLGEVRRRQGRLVEANELQNRAVAFFRSTNHSNGLASALTRTALIHCDLNEYGQAQALLEGAICQAMPSGYRFDEAQAHAALGDVLAALGLAEEARLRWASALAIYEEVEAPTRTVCGHWSGRDPF